MINLESSHPGWFLANSRDSITKTFTFHDTASAWSFVSRVANAAVAFNKHPEWRSSQGAVNVKLTTEDCGGLSEEDLKLATFMDEAERSIGSEDDSS
jgi:4a-hydroxytetrahydrobiopterin dehydratase